MIMVMNKPVAAGKFKATCLALLDVVERTGKEIVVTKRGRPVAKLVPCSPKRRRPLERSVLFVADDIVGPTGAWPDDT
jgi:prevent-host-death family protein